jgi:hypothetical protein
VREKQIAQCAPARQSAARKKKRGTAFGMTRYFVLRRSRQKSQLRPPKRQAVATKSKAPNFKITTGLRS